MNEEATQQEQGSNEQQVSNGGIVLGQPNMQISFNENNNNNNANNDNQQIENNNNGGNQQIENNNVNNPQNNNNNNANTTITEAITTEQTIQKDLEDKGVDWHKFSDEYRENGKLSEKSLEALNKAGYPKEVVDAYIYGVQAKAQAFVNDIVSYVGGTEKMTKLQDFVRSQPQAYIDTYNEVINSGNANAIKMMFDGISAKVIQKFGTQNNTILGTAQGGSGTPVGFTSKAEMIKALNDPRYMKDSAYRSEVDKKLANATFFSIS